MQDSLAYNTCRISQQCRDIQVAIDLCVAFGDGLSTYGWLLLTATYWLVIWPDAEGNDLKL